jgi:diadenosine tetraphosphatase ApaH/serine/threonine PP2A family protein phosphatase
MAGIGAVILLCFRCTGDIHIEESVFLIQQLEALPVQVRIRRRLRHHVAHTADEAGADEEAAGPAYGQGEYSAVGVPPVRQGVPFVRRGVPLAIFR